MASDSIAPQTAASDECPRPEGGARVDISARPQAEEALRESEERFRSLFEEMAQGVVYQDAEGKITAANPAAERILGLSLEEMHGTRSVDRTWRCVHEDLTDFPGDEHPVVTARLTGREVRDVVMGVYHAAEGEYRWIIVNAMPRFAGDGSGPCGAVVTFTDITDRKRSERHVASLAWLAEHALTEIFVVERESLYFVYANAAARENLGYTMDELRQLTPLDLSPSRTSGDLAARFGSLVSGAAACIDYMTENTRKDGSSYPIELHLYASEYDSRPVYVGIARDITERAEAEAERAALEAQLHHAQRLQSLGVLAGGVAHYFNNSLTAVQGFTELALARADPGSASAEYLQRSLEATARATELVRQVLAFGRGAPREHRPVSVPELVADALRLLRAILPEAVRIDHSLDPEAPPIEGDAAQIHQVILNLCSNAEHAMRPEGGTLRIRVEPTDVDARQARKLGSIVPGRYVVLSVSDTGRGMDEATRDRCFEPFFTTRPVGEGTGMGLATAHGIVASHGGAIAAESELGVGSTFRVYLPAAGEA